MIYRLPSGRDHQKDIENWSELVHRGTFLNIFYTFRSAFWRRMLANFQSNSLFFSWWDGNSWKMKFIWHIYRRLAIYPTGFSQITLPGPDRWLTLFSDRISDGPLLRWLSLSLLEYGIKKTKTKTDWWKRFLFQFLQTNHHTCLAWINNHTPIKVWSEIPYTFPNFNGYTVEVWE